MPTGCYLFDLLDSVAPRWMVRSFATSPASSPDRSCSLCAHRHHRAPRNTERWRGVNALAACVRESRVDTRSPTASQPSPSRNRCGFTHRPRARRRPGGPRLDRATSPCLASPKRRFVGTWHAANSRAVSCICGAGVVRAMSLFRSRATVALCAQFAQADEC